MYNEQYAILQAIRDPFLQAVSKLLGCQMTKPLSAAYSKAITFILGLFVDGFEHGVRKAFGPYGKGC